MLAALLKSIGVKPEHITSMAKGIEEARQDTKDIKELLQKILIEQQLTNHNLKHIIMEKK